MFPGCIGQGFTGNLRSAAGRYGWGKAEKLGPRSIRRGAARSVLDAAGSFAQVLRAGLWHSSAYRVYFDLGTEETKATASIMIEASDDAGPERRTWRDEEEIP